jgi:ubiquinone/menaquinone biosynthesis C-methylase UbiE
VSDHVIDPTYLAYQYSNSEKLRIRIDAHERYSEHTQDDWYPRYVAQLDPAPGSSVLDVGCGFGAFHPALVAAGARVLALDYSPGMAREARQRAARDGLPVQVLQADAQQIPLASHSVDHALASHMLYHVPDIRRALLEIKRVVKIGGRVLITTNAADHSVRLDDLHRQAAFELGLTPGDVPGHGRFSLDELPLVRSVFPNAERHVQPNAFLFPTVESALRYYASSRIDAIKERDAEGSHRPALLARVSELMAETIAREGVLRVSKDAGSFLATVEA